MRLKKNFLESNSSVDVLVATGKNTFMQQSMNAEAVRKVLYDKKRFTTSEKPGYVKVDDFFFPIEIFEVPALLS